MKFGCYYLQYVPAFSGLDNSVGIATDYELDGPGSNPGGDEIFPPVQTGPGAHPASCTVGTRSFPRVEAAGAWGCLPHLLLVPKVLEKCTAIPLLTLRACVLNKKSENLPTCVWTFRPRLI